MSLFALPLKKNFRVFVIAKEFFYYDYNVFSGIMHSKLLFKCSRSASTAGTNTLKVNISYS
jgi:hypothetical protein